MRGHQGIYVQLSFPCGQGDANCSPCVSITSIDLEANEEFGRRLTNDDGKYLPLLAIRLLTGMQQLSA
jgi:hypothetical protein